MVLFLSNLVRVDGQSIPTLSNKVAEKYKNQYAIIEGRGKLTAKAVMLANALKLYHNAKILEAVVFSEQINQKQFESVIRITVKL